MKTKLLLLALMLAAAPLTANEPSEIELREGYRGMTLTLDADQAAFTKAGDRIDIMATLEASIGKSAKEMVTVTLLQHVLVMKVEPSRSSKEKTILYLMLNPNEAQYLALSIDGKHDPRIVTRKAGDKEMNPMETASFKKLFR